MVYIAKLVFDLPHAHRNRTTQNPRSPANLETSTLSLQQKDLIVRMSTMSEDRAAILFSNGVSMPSIGYGCFFGHLTESSGFKGFTPEEGWAAIPSAIRAGYRNFDGALMYNTHTILGLSLGREMAEGRLRRSDVFVSTKIFHPPASVGFECLDNTVDMKAFLDDSSLDLKRVLHRDFERCLHELNLGYVDLLMLHWPGLHGTTDVVAGDRLRQQAWEVMEEIYSTGRARVIGVSNFLERHLEPIIRSCKVRPMLNQLEVNPYISQRDLVRYCGDLGICVQAWSPLGNGSTELLREPILESIAGRLTSAQGREVNVGQVILRWILQQGLAVLPKSLSEGRMKGNLDVFDFTLSEEDMNAIFSLNKGSSWVGTADDIA